MLHNSCWVPGPWQGCPPFCGRGLLQSLTRLNNPPPQGLLQLETGVQELQPPSTVWKRTRNVILSCETYMIRNLSLTVGFDCVFETYLSISYSCEGSLVTSSEDFSHIPQ